MPRLLISLVSTCAFAVAMWAGVELLLKAGAAPDARQTSAPQWMLGCAGIVLLALSAHAFFVVALGPDSPLWWVVAAFAGIPGAVMLAERPNKAKAYACPSCSAPVGFRQAKCETCSTDMARG